MSTWLIEPRDPLIARDGRPSILGRFESLPFPLPSTVAGAARTRMASPDGTFSLAPDEARKLLGLAVHGPVLAELEGEEIATFFAPAPLDAVLFESGEPSAASRKVACWRLAPAALPRGAEVGALGERGLQPVGFARRAIGAGPKEKTIARPPAFWDWPTFAEWLTDPADIHELDVTASTLEGLPRERRVHLAVEPGERVAVEGALFETEGLRFLAGPEARLAPRRFGLALAAEQDAAGSLVGSPLELRRELAPLGGERRLARWSESKAGWPPLPAAVREAIASSRRARLVLLTPAFFASGALPAWNGGALPQAPGVTVRVKGACVARAVVVSGWDLAADNGPGKQRGRPKPTRRLAPAGSVYFLELDGKADDLRAWCDTVWFQPVSDEAQACRDGFGLAALGAWPQETP